ncbi:hypothetical protein Poli38472_003286 [Pythium oligandrum]|uniref:HECT-type E3 ubiquitin transferase n=1 Tax=Pythium oligandrum TaxID=41045 RepID=A0A8K1FCM7_PYTOL|nr:hypothetical protein Poli38472_003286 [Pythium oligandrum]|eukprot:TMW57361.1 hypothetical protein Poli38472_003286 [Pythium oligandrum]
MASTAVLLIIFAQLGFFICTVISMIIMKRKMRRIEEERDGRGLQEALLDESQVVEHRIDAAAREASDGFERCSVCDFSNFTRFRYCALCGASLKRTMSSMFNETIVSSRQERARQRNEWTRKIDVEGRCFWYRASPKSPKDQFPGYCIRFHRSESDSTLSDSINGSTRWIRIPEALSNEVSNYVIELRDAQTADPTIFAIAESNEPGERIQETLHMAAQDFPSKFSHFVVGSSEIIVPAEREVIKISLHRAFMVEESVEHISCIDEKHLRSVLRINFLEESGVDAGGVHREWFMLLSEKLVAPEVGLFKCTDAANESYYLNSNSAHDNGDHHLMYLYAAGRIIGRAFLEGDILGFHLCLLLLKIILGLPVSFSDLQFMDPEAYKNMKWVLEHDDVESLGLDFTITEPVGGDMQTVELIPNGASVLVTDANKREYLDRRFRYTIFERVSSQLYVFLKGFYEVVPKHLLMLFDPEELDFVLCGSQEIDVSDWEKHSTCSKNLAKSRVRRWFWEIVREMPNEYRRRLLQFSTGSSRVPLVGFQGLMSYDGRICPFTLKGVSYERNPYIRSHACFNRLDIPLYATRHELRDVLYGILDTDVLGFTLA